MLLTACARSFELLSTSDGGVDFGASDPSGDGGTDAYRPTDAGPNASDAALDAADMRPDAMVPPGACAVPDYHMCTLVNACAEGGPNAFLWNGVRCEPVCLSQCVGPGCAESFDSLDECLSTHAACDPITCGVTGGVWDNEPSCDVYRCGGRFTPEECTAIVGTPGCVCPFGETFESGRGCAPDATCTPAELCNASGGVFRGPSSGGRGLSADYYLCGVNVADLIINGSEDIAPDEVERIEGLYMPECDCGHGGMPMAATSQCRYTGECRERFIDEDPSAYWRQLCQDSRGSWNPASNGHTWCGELQSLGTSGGCLCGARERFDSERGCMLDTICLNRRFGQYCETSHGDYCVDPDAVCQPAVPDELGGYCSVTDLVSACSSIMANPHYPQCRNAGTGEEGWYWADTNELICTASCNGHTSYCDTDEESDREGWFTHIAASCLPADIPIVAAADCE